MLEHHVSAAITLPSIKPSTLYLDLEAGVRACAGAALVDSVLGGLLAGKDSRPSAQAYLSQSPRLQAVRTQYRGQVAGRADPTDREETP